MELWTYSNYGLIATATDPAGKVTSYTYDAAGNLATLTNPANQITQFTSYDANNNLLSMTDANGNKLLSTTSTTGGSNQTYSYDAAGSRINDNNGLTNSYDNAGRLIQVQQGTSATQYSYNALGQRTQKTNSNGVIRFVYDEAGHLLGEYQANGTAIQETVWLGDTPIATIKPTADPQTPKVYYVWADHLGTPRQITDPSSNQLVWRWEGETFGNSLPNQDPTNSGQPFVYNLRFPGQYYNVESNRNYNYFRDYDPQTGHYIESDPIGLQGNINTYTYVEESPISFIDPLGFVGSRGNPAAGKFLAKYHAIQCVLPVQVEAAFVQINTNESEGVHNDGLQKKSPLNLPLVGIRLTISLNPCNHRGSSIS